MGKMEFTGSSVSYIFDGAAGMRDQLEQTILSEFQAKRYPLKATIQTIKAGGMLFGTKEQCVVIAIDKESQIIISNNDVGTYLYVEVYLMVQQKNSLFASISAMTDNIFKEQKRNAAFYAARNAMESAFVKLGLKQINNGFTPKESNFRSED